MSSSETGRSMSSSETGRSMSSNVIQPTSIDGPQIMEANTTTSMEPTTTISNTPTLARGSGRQLHSYVAS